MTTAEIIARARKRMGWTQAELAHRADVNVRTVRRWESGSSRPRNHHLLRLAPVLGLKPEDLQ